MHCENEREGGGGGGQDVGRCSPLGCDSALCVPTVHFVLRKLPSSVCLQERQRVSDTDQELFVLREMVVLMSMPITQLHPTTPSAAACCRSRYTHGRNGTTRMALMMTTTRGQTWLARDRGDVHSRRTGVRVARECRHRRTGSARDGCHGSHR